MSFYTSLTGLNAATAQLAVTSNNIANVGTTGFKRSRADFGDIFATSPLQKASSVIGQGVALKQVSQEFSQGNIAFSANSLDIAITGDGFFPLKSADGLQDIFTRNGTFLLDDSFNVVNSAGQALIAAAVDSSGKADLDNLSKLLIPRKTTGDAIETTSVTLGLNFPADATVISLPFDKNNPETYNKTTAVTVYDAGGNGYLATVYYAKTQVATPLDATNKWQTYVYIGDTKLEEKLIQANEGEEKLYVNKYGETRKESLIPPELIARGVTKLINLDDLKNPIQSNPAAAPGEQVDTTLNNTWKSGLNIYDQITKTSGIGGETQVIHVTSSATVGASTLSIALQAGTATLPITVELLGTETKFEVAAKIKAAIADSTGGFIDSTVPGRSVVDNGDGTVSVTFAKTDGPSTDIGNPDAAAITIAGTGSVSIDTPATTLYEHNEIAFELNVDGSDAPLKIDLSYLNDSTVDTVFTGVEIAREITNQINKTYGDERYFSFSDGALTTAGSLMKLRVLNTDSTNTTATDTLDITFTADGTSGTDGKGNFASLSEVTIEDALAAIQYQIDLKASGTTGVAANANFDNVTVEYDPVAQTFIFKNTDNYGLYASADQATQGLMGLTSSEVLIDPDTGTYAEKVIPNGALLVAKDQQRYGTVVKFDEDTRRFTISSGTTGDTSSLEIVSASGNANTLFGFAPTEVATSDTPLRGINSEPAVLKGNSIGLNLDNKFRVDASNNQFVVTVDNVTGLIQIPAKAEYTIEEFRSVLEDRINALSDSFGRSVNGVTVAIKGDTNKYFEITTGTTGNAAYLKVSANSIWGLAGVESARGTTSEWLEPKQASNTNGFPLYVDRDGMETTDPGDFSEDETRDLWSPIFFDKGELTFDTGGNIISPSEAIAFNSTTIGNSGATLQFEINYGASTQYSSAFAVRKQDQNGRPEGDLIGVDIGDDGLVSASYSNGTQKSLAKIVLVNFAAPTGLRQIGDSSYYATSKSGDAKYGEAGGAGFGTIRAGARERANVDLTTELVELITAQRNFQANAKAIETNNTLTQAIINIRS
jgi:flagellar hook-basal body protein